MRTLCVLLLLAPTVSFAGTVYRWTDSHGGLHYTDDSSAIPASYRGRAAALPQKESKAPPRMPAAEEKQRKVQTPKEVTPRRESPASDDDEYYYGFVDEDEGRVV